MLRKLREVAIEIGISYPTLKHWIYQGKIRTVRTVGGHHRIPEDEFQRLLGVRGSRLVPNYPAKETTTLRRNRRSGKETQAAPRVPAKTRISGRNKLAGKIREIELDGLLARVVLEIDSQTITAIITKEACLELDLKIGDRASALIKATEVMILK